MQRNLDRFPNMIMNVVACLRTVTQEKEKENEKEKELGQRGAMER